MLMVGSACVLYFHIQTVVQGSANQQQPQSANQATHHQRGELYRLKPKDFHAFNNSSSTSVSESALASSATAAAALRPGKKPSEMDRMLEEMKQKDADRQLRREQLQAGTGGPVKKRREIDQFLEELKERYRAYIYETDRTAGWNRLLI